MRNLEDTEELIDKIVEDIKRVEYKFKSQELEEEAVVLKNKASEAIEDLLELVYKSEELEE